MALDADDIRKLDEHIVEPLLEALRETAEAVRAQGERFQEALQEGLQAVGETLVDVTRENREHFERKAREDREVFERTSREQGERFERTSREQAERFEETSRQQAERFERITREQMESNEKLRVAVDAWTGSEKMRVLEIDVRVKALEEWRAEVEKKNGGKH